MYLFTFHSRTIAHGWGVGVRGGWVRLSVTALRRWLASTRFQPHQHRDRAGYAALGCGWAFYRRHVYHVNLGPVWLSLCVRDGGAGPMLTWRYPARDVR